MRLSNKPTLAGGLLAALMLITALPTAADERGHDGRHPDGRGWNWDGDRYGRHGRPGSWAPNVEVIVDGVSSGNRQPRRDPQGGPDRCHQRRSDSWSTETLDCPDRQSPSRSREWSSSP